MKYGFGIVLCLLVAVAAQAQPAAPGSRFEIRQSYETSERRGEASSGSSQGHSTMIEQVVAYRDGGVELVYDAPADSQEREWQLPVRVFKPASGPFELLNAAELEARVDPWLAKAKWTRDICEKWIFTWNAFKIDCDPASALDMIEGFNLWPDDLRDGALFRMEGLLGTPPLRLERSDDAGTIFVVSGTLDPEMLKRDQAKADVVVGQIVGKRVTEEAALAKLAATRFSGTIEVRFFVDPAGLVLKRDTRSEVVVDPVEGETETRSRQTSVQRRRL